MELEWSKGIIYEKGGKFKWPDKEGVYVIAKEIDKKLKARYVGQGNLCDRMKVHESDDEPNMCLKKVMSDRDDVKVYYAKVAKQTDRENVEYTLVSLYGGIENLCNETTPIGELDYTVNGPFVQKIDLA